jgi:hypothetical protein
VLTDIFARRYANAPLWRAYTDTEATLLLQAFRLVERQVLPLQKPGRIYAAEQAWTRIHDRLADELGLEALAQRSDGWGHHFPIDQVCKAFMTEAPRHGGNVDKLIKERLSFIELAFRAREEEVRANTAGLPERIVQALRGEAQRAAQLKKLDGRDHVVSRDVVAGPLIAETDEVSAEFRSAVDELNARFRQADTRLNYHNGFIQIGGDEVVAREMEKPFWNLVSDPKWKNVDTDMKEAIDLRDSAGRDPAFYAARALESTIKIISDEKKWTHGSEKGASNYIDNLGSSKNKFVESWESEALKAFFAKVRNPLGHGPGGKAMPALTPQQTDWAIETCMSWIKSLIIRL